MCEFSASRTKCVRLAVDKLQEFVLTGLIVEKNAGEFAGRCPCVVFLHAAHRHQAT